MSDASGAKRVLELRAANLGSLSKHPHFPELVAEVERRQERDLRRLVAKFVRSGDAVDQREFDRTGSFWAGALWVLGVPVKAEDTLRKALEQAAALREADDQEG